MMCVAFVCFVYNIYIYIQGISSALERAFSHYNKNKESWEQLVKKVMGIDFSWESSAGMYEELYFKSVARAKLANRS